MSLNTPADKDLMEHDWYSVLGIDDFSCSNEFVEKMARKMAIKFHPDKNASSDAPAKFLLIQKAKEILLDETKRKMIDQHRQNTAKRQQYEASRNSNMDARRKRMRDELNEKVSSIHKSKGDAPSKEELQQQDLLRRSKIIEELRKSSRDMMERSSTESILREEQRSQDILNSLKQRRHSNDIHTRQIKVRWKKSAESHSDDSLYQLFKQFGAIEDVTLSKTKGTSGMVTFTLQTSARAAYEHHKDSSEYRVTLMDEEDDSTCEPFKAKHGDLSSDIKRALEKNNLLDIIGKINRNKAGSTDQINATSGNQQASNSEHGSIVKPADFAAKESSVLQKMLEAARRKKEGASKDSES